MWKFVVNFLIEELNAVFSFSHGNGRDKGGRVSGNSPRQSWEIKSLPVLPLCSWLCQILAWWLGGIFSDQGVAGGRCADRCHQELWQSYWNKQQLHIPVPSFTALWKKTNKRGLRTEIQEGGHLAPSRLGMSLKGPGFQSHCSRLSYEFINNLKISPASYPYPPILLIFMVKKKLKWIKL